MEVGSHRKCPRDRNYFLGVGAQIWFDKDWNICYSCASGACSGSIVLTNLDSLILTHAEDVFQFYANVLMFKNQTWDEDSLEVLLTKVSLNLTLCFILTVRSCKNFLD